MKTELEQAAEKYAHNWFEMHETNNYKALKNGFIAGAAWQKDTIYSEKEVKSLLYKFVLSQTESINIVDYVKKNACLPIYYEEWFEQFKKK